MWTYEDDNRAWYENWWMGVKGIYAVWLSTMSDSQALQFVMNRAAAGSELHIKAIQHLALCKLLNVSAHAGDQ